MLMLVVPMGVVTNIRLTERGLRQVLLGEKLTSASNAVGSFPILRICIQQCASKKNTLHTG